ncbi:low temperature requirement protein A [Jiangella aurantiaca]|uniref:Low temperature requirement protein A n=1 Tax=Jiangella aurantiaca TaxID=2530373 RepID=A0A4R5A112_9ACTN|nr:low temperature requirement protein A [Jiangella aurantiaca]TDD64590.1 low temperature requirement protein A [Jiangella aurantiaca]
MTEQQLRRPRMRARSPHEAHRSATPLELLFDLCFVVAVAQAGARLVHSVAEGSFAAGVGGYVFVFFAIWLAWVNFTWFASAYDTDDVPYRIATFVQMCGVLVLAAGIPRAFDEDDFSIAVAGYVIMRLALVGQWLRAAHGETGAGRTTALRYAGGLVVVQTAWVLLLQLPDSAWSAGFVILAAADLSVPVIAERARRTGWHPHHIAERHGLFTIIVLGETIAAATVAVQSALNESSAADDLVPIVVGGLLVVFSAFWFYFAGPIHEHLHGNREAFRWGYGHYFVLGSAAAIGAGLEVAVEHATHHAHVSVYAAAAAVTIPASIYLFSVWLLHARHFKRTLAQQLVLPGAAVLVAASTAAGRWAVLLAGVVCAVAVAVGLTLERRVRASRPPG